MLQITDAFTRLWGLGYRRIVPVIPPGAEISPYSSLHKRVGTNQDARGKLPGTLGRHGWASWDWTHHATDPEDFPRWAAMGAGTGIVTGEGLLAIDADTLDENLARIIRDTVAEHFGPTPIRVGRYPKALYPIRVTGSYAYRRIEFGTERVEVLSDRKFFVAEGIHNTTGKPYHWPRPLVPYDDLPLFRPEQIDAFLADLRSKLPEASKVVQEGGGDNPINQAALKGDPALIRKAVEAIPNTSEHFPTRESYRDFGYAIKAAVEDENEAFDLFADWCARWTDGDNDPDVVRSDWRRMKPPFRRGAGYLYDLAERLSAGRFTLAEVHFQPVPESAPSPFDLQAANEREAEAADVYPLLTVDEIVSRPPPTFLVDRHVPDTSVGFLYSDPGAGKSFLAIDLGLSIAHGETQWHGDALHPPADAAVIYIASEGSFDLRNRIKAWHKARGKGAYPARFLVIERTINFMEPEDVDRLIRTVRLAGVKPAFVVVDTVSRAMPGADENLQKEMTLFVRACDHVRDTFQCAVLGVHHAGKSGDMRGSTVLRGAGDFVMRLERKRGASVGTLTMEKQKAAEDGWARQVIFSKIVLDDGQSSLVSDAAGDVAPGSGGMKPGGAAAVLRAMRAAWDEGAPWSKGHQGKERFAVRRIVADHGIDAATAEGMLALWEASGIIAVALRSARDKRYGYQVLIGGNEIDAMEQGNNDGGTGDVFD